MDYDELVQKLRDWSDTHSFSAVPRAAADAITKLRAERDALRVDLAAARAECVRRQTIIGEVALERDAARARLDSVAERDRLAVAAVEGVQQMRIDLAAARAESDLAHWLLRNARKYMNPMHEALCAAIDNVLQKKQAALAGKDAL